MQRLLICVFLSVTLATTAIADDLTVLPDRPGEAAPARVMTTYLQGLTREALDRRAAEFEKLETPAQLAAYQRQLRESFITQIGGFPERTPLNARIVDTLDRDGYRIEKLLYESRPAFFVTALLYLPNTEPPYPGVLVPCGHSANGKAMEAYQRACILLARNGMAALCYDPIGQGERYQILDRAGEPQFGSVHEHTLVGVGSILLGLNTASYRIWDGIRGIDYLVSRDDIDPERIGCTGNSGGGTLTSYIAALDDRVACAAPSCYLCSLGWIGDHIGPQDAEQNIHAQVARGMEHADYLRMRAPRPTLICAATRDFFDIGATWQTFRGAKRFYTRMGFAERIDLIETDAEHGFSPQLRVGMVRWMRRWLIGVDDAITESVLPVLTEDQARCTPAGQVLLMDGAKSVFDLNAELDTRLAAKRKNLWRTTPTAEALAKVRQSTGIRELDDLPTPEVAQVGSIQREPYRITKLILRPEPGIMLPALLFSPPRGGPDAYLYVHGEGKHVDAELDGPIDKLVRAGHPVLAVDLRGIGETQGRGKYESLGSQFGPDWQDFFRAYLLGRSYVGMRAEDILVCARHLAAEPAHDNPRQVHLIAIGEAGPPALHAAALEPQLIASIRIERSITSWSRVVRTPVTRNQLINCVHGALRTYDLPDLLATLPAGKATIIDPIDPAGEPTTSGR